MYLQLHMLIYKHKIYYLHTYIAVFSGILLYKIAKLNSEPSRPDLPVKHTHEWNLGSSEHTKYGYRTDLPW